MSSRSNKGKNTAWNIENNVSRKKHLLVICPKCGRIGTLYYTKKLGWYIKHDSRTTHYIGKDASLEIPLHSPRLNLVRYIGGDTFILPYLAKMIPPHRCYVEVFGGGAPLLLNKPPSYSEIYNDLDNNLVNLFNVIRNQYDEFIKKTEWLIVGRATYYDFLKNSKTTRSTTRWNEPSCTGLSSA